MTQRAIQNAKNQSAKLLLMNPRAFRQLAMIPIEESKKLRTFATDGKTIFVNVSYAKGLSDKVIRGILIHELLHILGKHGLRRGDFHQRLWNAACDYVINGWIMQSNRYGKDFTLPTDALLSERYSYNGRSAEEVARDLLNRGWRAPVKTSKSHYPTKWNGPPDYGMGGIGDDPWSGSPVC